MTERHKHTIGDALSEAQGRRTEAREAWVNAILDMLVRTFPERAAALEAERAALDAVNLHYVEILNLADAALIGRVTALLLNRAIDDEAALKAVRDELQRIREGQPWRGEP